MEKTNIAGVYKIAEGQFCYRLMIERKGYKKIDTTCRKGEDGKPFKTKTDAARALEKKRLEILGMHPQGTTKRKTLAEVYELYERNGTSGKAHSTLLKQESLWKNHIKGRFGDRFVNDISVGELNDYLAELYMHGDEYNNFSMGYSYAYVEGFLRFFYLLFGHAYRYDCYDAERYNKYFVNRGTKIQMPPKQQEDLEEDIEAYDQPTIKKIWNIVKNGNFELPFMLGYMLGTRISETFAIRWSSIDWINSTIKIDGQLLYQDGVWVIGEVKTLASVRHISVPKVLMVKLQEEYIRQKKLAEKPSWRATERVIDIRQRNNHIEIIGGDFVCRKENGELMTPNSKTYWVKRLKQDGIDFHFHALRKTHLTMLANMNTPLLEFCLRSGHKKIETARKYYIDQNKLGQQILKQNVETISETLGNLPKNLAASSKGGELSPKDFANLVKKSV